MFISFINLYILTELAIANSHFFFRYFLSLFLLLHLNYLWSLVFVSYLYLYFFCNLHFWHICSSLLSLLLFSFSLYFLRVHIREPQEISKANLSIWVFEFVLLLLFASSLSLSFFSFLFPAATHVSSFFLFVCLCSFQLSLVWLSQSKSVRFHEKKYEFCIHIDTHVNANLNKLNVRGIYIRRFVDGELVD